jgi:hypothetical protein
MSEKPYFTETTPCACPCSDARQCYCRRYYIDPYEDEYHDSHDDKCECACHYEDDEKGFNDQG